MTRERLDQLLQRNHVAERAYDLYGAHKHDALVLDHRPEGWLVFYSERGGENIVSRHDTEEKACAVLLSLLLDDPQNRFDLVAGPALPEEADAAFRLWLDAHGLRLSDLADGDFKTDEVPWAAGEPYFRRYFVHRKLTSA